MSIKILLADDHNMIRQSLRATLEKEPDFIVVGETDSGEKIVELAKKLNPHIIVMDISMPIMNGIEATKQILIKNSKIKVIGLSMYKDKRYILGMLNAGAKGYLLKESMLEDLTRAVRFVASDNSYLSPEAAAVLIPDFMNSIKTKENDEVSILTNREKEILIYIANGKTSKEIASTLSISTGTVDNHRKNLMKKLTQ